MTSQSVDLTPFQIKTKVGDVDTDLYSRQIATLGIEAQKRMQHLSVLIVGLNGVGVEVAKNVILAGVMKVVLYDPTPAQWKDLSSQFYLTEADVRAGRPRAEACVAKLRELNSYVVTEAAPAGTALTPEFITQGKFGCVVICDPLAHPFIELCLLNEFCRSQHTPIAFIMACSAGPLAFAFADFGAVHTTDDPDGLPAPQAIVSMISSEKKCVVTLAEESAAGGMPFSTGDPIHFTEVKGPTSLNTGRYRVGETTKLTFVLEEGNDVEGWHPVDSSVLPPHEFGTGQIFAHKIPLRMYMSSLSDSLVCPFRQPKLGDHPMAFMDVDFRKFGRPTVLHMLIRGLFGYAQQNAGQLPRPCSEEDADKLIAIIRSINEAAKRTNASLPAAWLPVAQEHALEDLEVHIPLLRRMAMHIRGDLSPMAAFLGGVIGQEVMKVTGKFTPLHQWLHFDICEMLVEPMLPPAEYAPMDCRYDGQILIFGRTLQRKLGGLKTFLVGTGALGCEFAKGFAMMGVGLGVDDGLITVTDMDTIEKSNLNRQFLFRPRDIGSHKSEAASRAMKEMNPAMEIVTHTTPVGDDTEDTFDDAFWSGLDIIVNALDNVAARTYTDNKCAFFQKPLLESGTTGTMANVQVVLPGKTECYSDSTDFAQNVGVPQCTIRNFPNLIIHCVEWSVAEETMGSFNKLFKLNIAILKEYAKDPQKFLEELPTRMNVSEQHEVLEMLHEALRDVPMTFEKCIAWARMKFEQFFHDQIVQLLVFHPPTSVDGQTGQPFWSGTKRMPQPIIFDPANPHHLQFIHCAANLRAFAFGLPLRRINTMTEYNFFVDTLRGVRLPTFVPVAAHAPAHGAEDKKEKKDDIPLYTPDEEEKIVQRLRASLPKVALDASHIRPNKFEKDDDANFHVDYCTACANLRGANYQIEPTDRLSVKTAAGRIIPALATTTAMVTGLVLNQMYLICQGCQDIAKYTNGSINIGNHVWGFAEPLPPRTIETSTEWRTQVAQYKMMVAEYKKAGEDFQYRVRAVPENHTRRDFIRFNGDVPMGEVVAHFKTQYGLDVKMVSAGKALLFDSSNRQHAARLAMPVTHVYRQVVPKIEIKRKLFLACTVGDPTTPDEIDETIFVPDVLLLL